MGEVYNPYPKLPKNIRQIGERDQILKLYVEDYVNTYLKRLYPAGGQDLRVGLLLGESRSQEGETILFVDGAMEMDGVPQGDKVEFTESAWKSAYQAMERMFPRRSIIGWFLCGAPSASLSPLNYWKPHSQYFNGKNQLMYLNSGLEGEEAIYMASEDGFYKLRGYYIYYERNQMMQDYMVSRKDAHRVESAARDSVIQSFRTKMDENRTAARQRRSTVGMLGTACGVLAILVMASGVVMLNNYNKMQEMESVIVSALPEGTGLEWNSYLTTGEKKKNQSPGQGRDKDTGEVEYEEIPGQVYPTRAEIVIETQAGAGNAGSGTSLPAAAAGSGNPAGAGNPGGAGNPAGAVSPAGAGNQAGTGNAAGTGALQPNIAGGETMAAAGTFGSSGTTNGAAGAGESAGAGTTGGSAGAGASAGAGTTGGAAGAGESAGAGTTGGSAGAGASAGAGTTGGSAGAGESAGAGTTGGSAAGGTAAAGLSAGQAAQPVQIPSDAVRYVVQDGETLYGICMERYHNLRRLAEICQWNQLEDENRLSVGQELYLPPAD